jgi:predicted Fe-Mo cluster-binding NifX family protein
VFGLPYDDSRAIGQNRPMTTEHPIVIAVNLAGDQVGGGWGRAHSVGLAQVAGGEITSWSEYEVGWEVAHDEGTHGSHHARIVRFLREHDVAAVVTGHMGPPMERMLTTMGIATILGVGGPARAMVEAVAASLADDQTPPAA